MPLGYAIFVKKLDICKQKAPNLDRGMHINTKQPAGRDKEMLSISAGRCIHRHVCVSTFLMLVTMAACPLYDALGHHGVGHLHEAGHVGTLHVVDVAVGLRTILHAVLVNVLHDVVQFGIHLLGTP